MFTVSLIDIGFNRAYDGRSPDALAEKQMSKSIGISMPPELAKHAHERTARLGLHGISAYIRLLINADLAAAEKREKEDGHFCFLVPACELPLDPAPGATPRDPHIPKIARPSAPASA